MIYNLLQRHHWLAVSIFGLLFILYLNYYYSYIAVISTVIQPYVKKIYDQVPVIRLQIERKTQKKLIANNTRPTLKRLPPTLSQVPQAVEIKPASKRIWPTCSRLNMARTNITTWEEFVQFNFKPRWMFYKTYWDKAFEAKYKQKLLEKKPRPPLKVILIPHSHNDPGWLKTFQGYFDSETKHILDNVLAKLLKYEDFRFIWTEICFLEMWWSQAEDWQKAAFRKLVDLKRIEITTGGWVMTDEANVHVYAMLDQLIEGHHWLKTNLNVTPTVGWSVDPFGHGATMPYLLSANNFHGTVIQRVHFDWKEWFALNEASDFMWTPAWELTNKHPGAKVNNLLTHNMPFDIYTTDASCGPAAAACRMYDFRLRQNWIRDDNVVSRAKLLVDQYRRTASMFPHNVAMVLIGGDFNFKRGDELDAQYSNYKKLIDHINGNKEKYNAEVMFGTPADYFREIQHRQTNFPTLQGDFFVYSDIFTEGHPGYWSGYYTTRPLFKLLSTELEHNLRSAEILFTLALNIMNQWQKFKEISVLIEVYKHLIVARRNLGLFQHHDAITGTSRHLVMNDYGNRLFQSILIAERIQEITIEAILHNENVNLIKHESIESDLVRTSYLNPAEKKMIKFNKKGRATFVVFNSLAQTVFEPITLLAPGPGIVIFNDQDEVIPFQITHTEEGKFEVFFVHKLRPLSLVTFKARKAKNFKYAKPVCANCKPGLASNKTIQLENSIMKLEFDPKSGFLKKVTKKRAAGEPIPCEIKFGGYKAAPHSGAYLFKTNSKTENVDLNVLEQYKNPRIVLITGSTMSSVTVHYGPLLNHTVRIFHTKTYLDEVLYIENNVNLTIPNVEFYMRFNTSVNNCDQSVIYTDQNGFQYQKRVKVPDVGIEGNYYPITQSAFIQDKKLRLTLLTNHAQGAASLACGQLEVMLDRRTPDYDWRGMGEGVMDNRPHRQKFWLTLEALGNEAYVDDYQVPSLLANRLANQLRYPANVFVTKKGEYLGETVPLMKGALPCNMHLMNLRTISAGKSGDEPSRNALMLLHRQAFRCDLMGERNVCNEPGEIEANIFDPATVESVAEMTVSGLTAAKVLGSFRDIKVEPMEIKTFNVTFSLD